MLGNFEIWIQFPFLTKTFFSFAGGGEGLKDWRRRSRKRIEGGVIQNSFAVQFVLKYFVKQAKTISAAKEGPVPITWEPEWPLCMSGRSLQVTKLIFNLWCWPKAPSSSRSSLLPPPSSLLPLLLPPPSSRSNWSRSNWPSSNWCRFTGPSSNWSHPKGHW